MNQEMANEFGNSFFYYKDVQGFILEHKDFLEMANELNLDYKDLESTINSYNEGFEKKLDEFNKTTFPYKFDLTKKVYSMIITPSIHYTMGGLKINNKGEILNSSNERINGLYGAGEVTGGVHGGNRLGGNSLAECGVYGRISANSAVNYILNKGKTDISLTNRFFKYKKSERGLGGWGILGIIIPVIAVTTLTFILIFFSDVSMVKFSKKEPNIIPTSNKSINFKSS